MEKHTWCLTHRWPTSGWPGTWGRHCALKRYERNPDTGRYEVDCKTEARTGVVSRWDRETRTWVDAVDGKPFVRR